MSVIWSDEQGSWERRQKPGMFVSGKQALKFFAWLAFWAAVVGAVIWMNL